MSASPSVSEQSVAHHRLPSDAGLSASAKGYQGRIAVLSAGGSGGFTALRTRLLSLGYEVREYFDFSEIVDRMPVWRPDAIVADLGKVKADTLSYCEFARTSNVFRHIPLIGYFPNREMLQSVRLEDIKMDDCLVDPCEGAEIVFRIRKARDTIEQRRLILAFEQYKMDLVEAIAHDVRSPLHTISFALDLMLESDSGSDPKFSKLLNASKTSTSQITEVMDMMLNIQRLEEENANVTLTRANLAKVMDEVFVRFDRPAAASHDIPGDIFVQADLFLLERILSKILKNCLRYIPEKDGKVEISVLESNDEIAIFFVENAPPIPPEHYERVFQMFARIPEVDGKLGRSFGLDFAYCRAAVKGQKGFIGVGKTREGWNQFSVILPRDW